MLRELIVNNTVIPVLKRGLDAFSARHRAISTNLVNHEVPGYRRQNVVFEDKLKLALADRRKYLDTSSPRHLPIEKDPAEVVHHITYDKQTVSEKKDNHSDADDLMAEMATNQIQYHFTARAAQHEFTMLRKASQKSSSGV